MATRVVAAVVFAPQIEQIDELRRRELCILGAHETGTLRAMTPSHMTTTTTATIARPADCLRAALKRAGYNSRRVSVRGDHSTLRVTIRDASVSRSKVHEIAGAFESVSRDHATGEILAGGDIFI